MAADTNALTLADHAMVSNSKPLKKIVYSLHETMNVLKDIPLKTEATLTMNGIRFVDNLPGVNTRAINGLPTITKGKPTPWQEQVYTYSNQFQIDKKLMNEKNLFADPIDVQFGAWSKAFAYSFNNMFFNNAHDGSSGSDINAPVGLRARLDNTTKWGVASEMKIDAGGIDLSGTITTTIANNLIEWLEQMLDYMGCPDGNGVVIYMNDQTKRRFNKALRIAGPGAGYTTTKDAFGRELPGFRGARIQDVGRTADQSTRIITNTELSTGLPGGASDDYTSVYAVRYGDDYFSGWQYDSLDLKHLGIDPTNGVLMNSMVDYSVGFWMQDTRSIARIYDIKVS